MRRILWTLLIAACGITAAQAPLTAFEAASLGYRLGYPSGWTVQREGGDAYLSIQPPQGSAEFGRAAIEFVVADDVTTSLDEAMDGVLAGLRAEHLPDLTVVSRAPATVSGVPALVVRLTGTFAQTPVSYRLVGALEGGRGYVLFLEAVAEHAAAYEALFDQVLASFSLTSAQAAPPSPLAPGPLPVSPAAPWAPAPTYEGTFSGEQLRLTLAGPTVGSGAYGGSVYHGDQQYALSAQVTPQGLAGEFESGGHRYPFTATLAGDHLTFETGGATYLLVRDVPTPVAPANPLGPASGPVNPLDPSGAPSVGATAPPSRTSPIPTPAEVVARETTSAFVGALAPNGAARGRLDGVAEAFGFHTYVVDLPAGVVRLVIELDADDDLDIALKHGSEIMNYADRDRGGDWDYRDIETHNPTTLVVEGPAGGLWYIDVINALGASRTGTYRLTVATTGP